MPARRLFPLWTLPALGLLGALPASAATVVLYDQDFEAPAVYNNDGGDLNIYNTVNQNYGNQPVGFSFAQAFTVETLNVSGSARGAGSAAFGTGWSDPSGIGGDFAIGMLSSAQNDLLGLSFDVGTLPFFNFELDVSGIDLTSFGAPFQPPGGAAPDFQFTLYDNPGGGTGLGGGTILDQATLTGTLSARDTFDWTRGSFAFDSSGATDGNVTLVIDLLSGGYGAFDNIIIAASTDPGDTGGGTVVPLPAGLPLILSVLAVFAGLSRRGRR